MTSSIDFMSRPAIDLHAHFGIYPGYTDHQKTFASASAEELSSRARACSIVTSVISNMAAFDAAQDKPSDIPAANALAARAAEQNDNLRFYAVLSPRLDHWQEHIDSLLSHPKCAGVKLHPLWNFWDVDQYGDEVFGFLNQRKVLVSTHSGQSGTEPQRFIPWANKYPDMKLILAHIGNDTVNDRRDAQVNAVKAAKRNNVWADTSSSVSILARLIEYAVEQIGPERIVFGTDAPGYFSAAQKARIAYADIPATAKQKILYDNAASLLGL